MGGQGLHGAPFKLHEDVIPDFDVIGVITVDAFGVHFAEIITQIDGDFGTGATGSGIGHHPEVVFFAEA